MSDDPSFTCVAELVGDGADKQRFMEWCYFMRGVPYIRTVGLCRMTPKDDAQLHAEAWGLFDQWQDWQEDFYREGGADQ